MRTRNQLMLIAALTAVFLVLRWFNSRSERKEIEEELQEEQKQHDNHLNKKKKKK